MAAAVINMTVGLSQLFSYHDDNNTHSDDHSGKNSDIYKNCDSKSDSDSDNIQYVGLDVMYFLKMMLYLEEDRFKS